MAYQFHVIFNAHVYIFFNFQVVPPKEYVARKIGYDVDRMDIRIKRPILQKVVGQNGIKGKLRTK